MAQKNRTSKKKRDETIKQELKQVLGMSVPKYISIMYGRSQKAAQIMFNQPERRHERDEALLDEISEACRNPDTLSARFIGRILGSDQTVLSHIQTTIDLRFQSLEAGNTVKSLTRPILSEHPAIRQIEMINQRYFYLALDMQNEWSEAKKKQEQMKGQGAVHIPYTLEQIKNAFQVVIDMCLLIIDLKAVENSEPAREALARAYALSSAAAIQIGRYDLIEEFSTRWRDHFELHIDTAIPLRVRNLLFQKELWIFKRKGEYARGLEIAEEQWSASATEKRAPRWIDVEPLVCAGLELASLRLKKAKDDEDVESAEAARDQIRIWLERLDKAPERAAELGGYLQNDPELKPVREESEQPSFRVQWRNLMKKFGVLTVIILWLAMGAAILAVSAMPQENDSASVPSISYSYSPDSAVPEGVIETAGANPGSLIQYLINMLLGLMGAGQNLA